jgi:hypothetical protein
MMKITLPTPSSALKKSTTSLPKNTFTFKVLLALFFMVLGMGVSLGQTSGDYQTNGNVTFASATNWQKYNGSAWATATAAPTSADGVITIRNANTATIGAAVSIDQVVVQSGGILTHTTSSAVVTIANGVGDDITIESGGVYVYTGTTGATLPTFSSGATFRVKTGGMIRADGSTGTPLNFVGDALTSLLAPFTSKTYVPEF